MNEMEKNCLVHAENVKTGEIGTAGYFTEEKALFLQQLSEYVYGRSTWVEKET